MNPPETFGDPTDPAILLITGSTGWWEDELVERLAAGPRFVIRYDHCEQAADAVDLLDALGLPSAHLVGGSMCGAIAERLARDHTDRVESLTLIPAPVEAPPES